MGLNSTGSNLNRPYHSEQAIPTLEELVGVSELYNPFSVEGEAKAQLDGLLKGLDPLTYSISIEEENQGKLQAFLKSPTNLDLVTHDLSSLDCEISNVLLTRAERHRSRLPPRACLERDSELWGGCGRAAQSQSPERSKSSEVCQLSFSAPKRRLAAFRMTIISEVPIMFGWTRRIRVP